jgi:hypothetical protein
MVYSKLSPLVLAFYFLALSFPDSAWAFGKKSADNRPDAASSILAAFQGSCGSQGIFTQSANAQTTAIINVFETLKNTDACKPFVSELTSVQNAANALQSLQSSNTYLSYQTDENQYQLLTIALQTAQATENSSSASAASVAQAASDAASYQSAIGQLRLQLFSDQAAYQTTNLTTGGNQLAANTASMIGWAQQLTSASSSPDLAQCLKQSPIAALELGTNLAAYGGSLLPGAFGAGIATVATLISNGLDALHDSQYDDAIFNAQSNEMRDSLSCALESMTESYCTMDDAYTLLDLARDNRLANYSATPLWRGLDILNRQLPSLLQWLSQVQNEVPPQDSGQANKQNGVFQEIFEVQEQNLISMAAINNALDQAASSSTQSAKQSAIVNAIANLSLQLVTPSITIVGGTTETSSQTPFIEYQPNATIWACWLVLGPNTVSCPAVPTADQNFQGSPQLFQMVDYIQNALSVNNADQVAAVEASLMSNWSAVVPKVQVLVNSDFARIIATNAGTILASARVASQGNPVSPYVVLQNIQTFLSGIAQGNTPNPLLGPAVSQELTTVQAAIDQLTKADADVCPPQVPSVRPPRPVTLLSTPDAAPSSSPSGAPSPIPLTPEQCETQRLVSIFNLFGLQNGTQVFLTDIDKFVNIDLQNRFADGEIPSGPTQILQASGTDLDITLQSAGQGDLVSSSSDLDHARSDVEGNIEIFREFFTKGFQAAVKREAAFIPDESMSAGADRPHGQPLAELCMLWLFTSGSRDQQGNVVSNWPDPDTQAVCEQTLFFNANTNPGGPVPTSPPPLKPAFDLGALAKQMSNLRFADRVCAFHRFKIQNKADTLYQMQPPTPR